MNLVVTVLEIVAPAFLLAAIGFAWVRLGHEYHLQFVSRLATNLSIPCLIFVSLTTADIAPDALAEVALAGAAAMAAITLCIALLVRLLRLEVRTYLSPLTFGNTGNLGLPLALFAFGETGLSYAIVLFAVISVWNFTYGIWVISGKGAVTDLLREPMVTGTALGGLFLWQGWQVPDFVETTLGLLGQLAIPLMLLTLGVAVARLTPAGLGRAFGLSVAKLLLCTGIGWTVGRWFALEPLAFGALVLQCATPVAVTSYILAERYGADAEAVAGLIVASTLLATAALPLLLGLLL